MLAVAAYDRGKNHKVHEMQNANATFTKMGKKKKEKKPYEMYILRETRDASEACAVLLP